ncbi:hypothetical protein [Amycolatopsis pigmentata]|uniref:ABC transporter permease n=1 Tax=Amycolatopsis pigmentata TaxID=450801 RepID=A0ABW5G317_9PSEU
MSTPTADPDEITDRVRQVLEDAQTEGRPRPGRPTIVELTGFSEYQVKKALAALADTESPAEASVSSASPVDPEDGPDTEELPAVEVDEPAPLGTAGDPLEMSDLQDNSAGDPAPPADLQPITRRSRLSSWPLFVIGLGAAVAVWSGWVGLGRLCGFGMIQPLPGIVDKFQLNTAIVLPLSVEAYGAYALRCWLSAGQYSDRTVRFAKISSVASLVIGAGAQIAYHLMAAAHMDRAPWQITMLVACVPVAVLGLASALAKLVTADHQRASSAGGEQ